MTETMMAYRKNNRNPRLLSHVVKAVKYLREIKGSSASRITNQVRSLLNVSRMTPKPRDVVSQVKRALNHAVQKGILLHRAGRYKVHKRKRLVPVDSLELCNINSRRNMRFTKTRVRRDGRNRYREPDRSRRRRRNTEQREKRRRSLSEETPSPSPEPKNKGKTQQKNTRVTFKDARSRGKKSSKNKVNQETNENAKNQVKPSDVQTKLSQRPKTPYVSYKEMMDNEGSKSFSKQHLRTPRRPTGRSQHRSVSRSRSPRGPTVAFRSSSPMRASRVLKASRRSPVQRQKSFTNLKRPNHDDTSSESLLDDDDDLREGDNISNNY